MPLYFENRIYKEKPCENLKHALPDQPQRLAELAQAASQNRDRNLAGLPQKSDRQAAYKEQREIERAKEEARYEAQRREREAQRNSSSDE